MSREPTHILLRDQRGHALIIDDEKILQVRKLISSAQCLNRRIGQRNAIAARQRKHQFGLEAAPDVNVYRDLSSLIVGEPQEEEAA
jgi:hypothetical protein